MTASTDTATTPGSAGRPVGGGAPGSGGRGPLVEEAGAAASASVGSRRVRAPDFFIVGHPKCGTTALYRMLRSHPQIFMPDIKEPWFLAPELRSPLRGAVVGKRPETLGEYLALFAPARPDQRAGEASSSYLMSRSAAGRIAELAPRARIVAILREPASFLRSLHLQSVQVHVEIERDLRRALALEPERRRGRHIPPGCPRPQALFYSEQVRYVEQLRRYHELFGRAQVLVLIYDDFRAKNEATVRRVLRFLDVDELAPLEMVEANPTVGVRSLRLHRAVQAVSVGGGPVADALKASVKRLTSRRLRHAGLRAVRRGVVFGAPPPPDAELMAELRRRFAPEVVALSEYLERDLVGLWGYDGLG
jgi:Sulfotransferase family